MSEAADELKLLQDSYLRIWSMYTNFMIWFYGANALGAAALSSSKDIGFTVASLTAMYAIIMLAISLIAAVGMLKYQRRAYHRALVIVSGNDAKTIVEGVLANGLARAAIICIVISHPVVMMLWVGVAFLKWWL
jgi:hypothetical protein